MRSGTSFAGVVHPSHNLILAAYSDYQGAVGHVVRSTDGGIRWTDTAMGISIKAGGSPNAIRAIATLDSNYIVMLISGQATNICDSALLSSDGGVTWRSVPTPHFQVDGSGFGMPPNPVVAYQVPHTLLVAANNAYPNSVIYRSTDLGITWDSGFQANKTITKFAFINPQIGFASGTIFDLNLGTETAEIDKTTDGGLTWTNILSKQIVPFSTSLFNNTAGLYSIAFADSLHGFACGDQGLILQTADGGTTWNELHSDFMIDAQSNDLLSDVAYPDTNHAMIASGDGAVLVYHPNGILSLPNITYPHFSPPAAPQTFNVTWDPVPGATRYSIAITTSGYPDSNTTLVLKDSNFTTAYFHLSNLVDTSPGQAGRQYYIYLQAFNATNQSNTAQRTFIVYKGTSGVKILPSETAASIAVYPNPAHDMLNVEGLSGKIPVVDALGRAYRCPWQDGKLIIANLPAGVYYVGDGATRAQFVKE